MPTKSTRKPRDLRTIRKRWQVDEKTMGGLGGNWTHTSYYHTKSQAEKRAKKVRDDLKRVKNSLKLRHHTFSYTVTVSKRKK